MALRTSCRHIGVVRPKKMATAPLQICTQKCVVSVQRDRSTIGVAQTAGVSLGCLLAFPLQALAQVAQPIATIAESGDFNFTYCIISSVVALYFYLDRKVKEKKMISVVNSLNPTRDAELVSKTAKLDLLQMEVVALQERLSELPVQSAKQGRITDLESEVAELQGQLANAAVRIADLQQQQDFSAQELENARQEAQIAQSNSAKMEQTLVEVKNERNQLFETLKEVRLELETALGWRNAMKTELGKARAATAELQAKVDAAEAGRRQAIERMELQMKEVETLRGQVANLGSSHASLQEEIGHLMEELALAQVGQKQAATLGQELGAANDQIVRLKLAAQLVAKEDSPPTEEAVYPVVRKAVAARSASKQSVVKRAKKVSMTEESNDGDAPITEKKTRGRMPKAPKDQ